MFSTALLIVVGLLIVGVSLLALRSSRRRGFTDDLRSAGPAGPARQLRLRPYREDDPAAR
jgi:hypothetical protein